MAIETVPEWMAGLEDEDLVFIKKFVLASGSLKEMAGEYGVTYPTVRLRLDRGHCRRPLYRPHQAADRQREAGL